MAARHDVWALPSLSLSRACIHLNPLLHLVLLISPSLKRFTVVTKMQAWKNFSANLPAVDVSGVSKNLRNTMQATKWVWSNLA